MKKHFVLLACCCAVLLSPLPTFAEAKKKNKNAAVSTSQVDSGKSKALERCATKEPDLAGLRKSESAVRSRKESRDIALEAIEIPVQFLVVRASGQAQLDEARLDQQVAVLNADYAPTRIKFFLSNVAYFDVPTEVAEGERMAFIMKQIKADKKERYLGGQMTVVIVDGFGALGKVEGFPWDTVFEDKSADLILLTPQALPGGEAPYQLGRTLTHEVGHWLGLLHTHQNGCNSPGDYVDDTPNQRVPTFGCFVGQDSCKSDPGADPVSNFMSYSDDECLKEFTPNQIDRIQALVKAFRPQLVKSNAVAAPATTISPPNSVTTPASTDSPSGSSAAPAAKPKGAADSINDLLKQ